jgi:hypothetical protein
MSTLTLRGELCELGDIEPDAPGIRIQLEDGRLITVLGLTVAEIQSLPAMLFTDVSLTLSGEAA